VARRSDPPGSTTISTEDGSLAGHAAAERRSLPWWRLRTWRKDLDALTRLRDGLQELEFDEPDELAGPGPSEARSAVAGATTVSPAGTEPLASGSPGTVGRPADEVSPSGAASGSNRAAGQSRSADGSATERKPDPAIVAIQTSFAHVAAAGDEAVAYFYAWLFLQQPELRQLFPPAMDEQRDRLFRALGRIVESLSTPDEMARYLSQLGRDHRKYRVEPAMYDAVGAALIATLRAFAKDDFTPAAEEAWGQTYAAASALMIRAAEEDAVSAPAYWTAEVVQVEYRSHEIAVLTIAPDQVFPYEAGQHLTLQVPRWRHVWRPYSIACRPRDDSLLTLHVKSIPGGWVSGSLVRDTKPGDDLVLGPAMGTMTLRPAGSRDLLCVAGGTGLAPIKAVVEQAVRDSAAVPRRIYLFYGARKRDELYDLKDLWRLSDAYQGLHLTPVTSDDPAFDGMQGNVGRVAARYMPHRECEVYVAGPADMVRETIRVLGRAGVPRERVHYDDALLAARPRVGSGM
jgi:NAD(P)H-flavin reductase